MSAHPTIPEPVNVVVRALLRSPLHRAMSHNTMLLSVTGCKTGRVYHVPISYSRDGEHLVCYTDAAWWKNLRGGATVTVVLRGHRRRATAQVVSGPAVAEHLARHLCAVPRDAKYHGVRLRVDGTPEPGDLARAAETTVMIRIRPIGDAESVIRHIQEPHVMIKTLRLLGWIAGITLITLGVSRMLFSMTAVPGGGAVNATVDSESRAAGALLITFGLAYIWAMRRSPIPSALLRVLAMTMALLAVARVISMIETGLPHWIFTIFTIIEFVAAVLTYWYSTLQEDHSPPAARTSGLNAKEGEDR